MNPILRATGGVILSGMLVALAAGAESSGPPASKGFFVYFGTYTNAKTNGKGIYRATLDVATGRLGAPELAAECHDPAFLAVSPGEKFLCAIDEGIDPAGTPGRGVRSYAIDRRTGRLTFLNEQGAGGAGPCHLSIDRTGRSVEVANYSGGSVAALPFGSDGRLGAPGRAIQHTGSSVNPARQKEPHAHAIVLSPDNRFALSPDLGIDKVMVYRLDAVKAALSPNAPASIALPPGSGPRHAAFSPSGRFVYVINELLCTLAVFAFDPERGELHDVQRVSTLPPGETAQPGFSTAEVAVHPSGRFLFGSNRGHNSIVVFAIDPATGRLTHVQNESTQGRTPRHFALDPTGAWLLAENQDSGSVVVFRIDPASGRLAATGQSVEVPSPVCAVFVAR